MGNTLGKLPINPCRTTLARKVCVAKVHVRKHDKHASA